MDFKALRRSNETIIAALERAVEVAGQGCEFCDAMVDDMREVEECSHIKGQAPAHAWVCLACWNASAQETSTIIGHFSDLLDRALEEIALKEA